jgi:hypothetical protein
MPETKWLTPSLMFQGEEIIYILLNPISQQATSLQKESLDYNL